MNNMFECNAKKSYRVRRRLLRERECECVVEHAYRCIIFVSNQPHNDAGEKGKYENRESSLYCPRGFK